MSDQEQIEDSAPLEGESSASDAEDRNLLREQLDEALREKEQFRALAQRAHADLINYKRRSGEELEETRRHARAHLLAKILPVADDLDRAIDLARDDADAKSWRKGLELVRRNLAGILELEGVTKIEAEGRPFEPREHEAVFYEETPDGTEGMVVRVIRDGYRLHEMVLRATQVAVSKAPEPTGRREQQETNGQEA